MKITGFLVTAGLMIGTAQAQSDSIFQYNPDVAGVAGVYTTADITGWALEAPLIPEQPTWLRDNFSLIAPSTHASCNIFGQRLDLTAAQRQTVIDELRSMSATEFATWMNPELDAQSDGAIKMTDFSAPQAYATDGLDGISVQFILEDVQNDVTMKLNSYQLFHQAGIITVTCGIYAEYFNAQKDIYDRFADQIRFFTNTGTLASILNEQAHLALTTNGPVPDTHLVSNAAITSTIGKEAIPQSLIKSAHTIFALTPKGLKVTVQE